MCDVRKRVNKMKILIILFWKDCCKQGSDTQPEDNCKEFKLMELMSVGLLIHETSEFITLGNDYCAEYKNYRDVVTYPKSGINKISRINIDLLTQVIEIPKGYHDVEEFYKE